MADIIQNWQKCKPGTLGAILYQLLNKWLGTLHPSQHSSEAQRFVLWTKQISVKGMFNTYDEAPPEEGALRLYVKQAALSAAKARLS